MKLEVGMYVRTDNGIIGKLYEQIGDMFTYKDSNRDYITYGLSHNEILKASYDIIDLIEEGDYVNGQKIYYDEELDFLYVQSFDADGCFYQESITKGSFINNIKTIVTKEQFEQMSYKVGE